MNSYSYSSSSYILATSTNPLSTANNHDYQQQILSDSSINNPIQQLPLQFPSNSQTSLNMPSSSSPSQTALLCSNRGRKRKRKDEKEIEKPKEVIHVRAKRGQATDSHSLAERVRREKINEKLRCLQDLVPGCYKTMGMAVMLDVIINYIQSLQNQIEFLSMKLSAASMHYDFNLERDNLETMQQATNAYVVQELERMEKEQEMGGLPSYFHSTEWAL